MAEPFEHKELPVEKDLSETLVSHGVQGLFVITKDGIPVVERFYKKENNFKAEHSYLVGGFFSALAKFANELTEGSLLSDVGFSTIRIHIEFTPEILFLLVFDESKLQGMTTDIVRMLLKGTLSSVKSVFQAYFGETELADLKNPIEFNNLRNVLIKMGPTLDKMVLESHVETLSIFQDSQASPFRFGL